MADPALLALRDRPAAGVLLENVPGLTRAPNKSLFQKLIEILRNIGYGVKATIVNSNQHGLAQTRPRVYVAAIKKSANAWGFGGDQGSPKNPPVNSLKLMSPETLNPKP